MEVREWHDLLGLSRSGGSRSTPRLPYQARMEQGAGSDGEESTGLLWCSCHFPVLVLLFCFILALHKGLSFFLLVLTANPSGL